MPTYYCLTFMCCQPCLPTFQCFQSCVSWTPFCIFSFCCVSHAVVSGRQERNLGWPYLRLDQMCLSRLAEYDDVIKGHPFLVLPPAPPTLNPPLGLTIAIGKFALLLHVTTVFWKRKVYLNRKVGGGCTRLVVFNLFCTATHYSNPLQPNEPHLKLQ